MSAAADKSFTQGLARELADILVPIIQERLQQQPAGIQKLLYTIPEAAAVLGCSKRALEADIASRRIAVVRRGKRVYIHKRDIEAFIEANRE